MSGDTTPGSGWAVYMWQTLLTDGYGSRSMRRELADSKVIMARHGHSSVIFTFHCPVPREPENIFEKEYLQVHMQ